MRVSDLPAKIPHQVIGRSPGYRFYLNGDILNSKKNSFPQRLLDMLVEAANLPGYLGNCHSSDTVILDQLVEEHMKTGKPIFYTSADLVFQIAYHEETFGVKNLYQLWEVVIKTLDEGAYNIGRVIARPFIGNKAGCFQRTGNRRDYSVESPAPTILQAG